MKYIDVHAHLHHPDFDVDREEVLARMREAEVRAITVGTDYEESKKAVALAEKYPDLLWATVGLHPTDNTSEGFDIEKYKKLANNPKVVAIGECGLDYYRTGKEMVYDRQKEVFWKQLELAVELDKPLMVHCRPSPNSMDVHEDMLVLLSIGHDRYGKKLRGNTHFFTGTRAIAERYFGLGFSVSFSGVITFAREYDELVRFLPLDMVMVETDAPFASPLSHRGQRNEPSYIVETVQKIVSLRRQEDIIQTLVANSQKLFRF